VTHPPPSGSDGPAPSSGAWRRGFIRVLTAPFRLYRNTLGLLLPDACRFTPSCSHYAEEALATRGLLLGTLLTVWRVLRCQPFSKGGYDPVPERRRKG
jgi:putative membrane protein insertion efficiency factor